MEVGFSARQLNTADNILMITTNTQTKSPNTKLDEQLISAMQKQDAVQAGRLSDLMRSGGMNYRMQVEKILSLGFSAGLWEELMYEADFYHG